MAFPAAPIDFVSVRAAIVAVLAVATGLPESQIIYEQPEEFDSPRPNYPYVGVTVLQAAGMTDPDFYVPLHDEPGETTPLFSYVGLRKMDVTIDTYAKSHDTAYTLASIIQARLMQVPVQDMLRSKGLVFSSAGGVTDVSELMNTFYEGRAQLDVSFGLVAHMDVDMGRMDQFDVAGLIDGPPPTPILSPEEP